MDKTTQPFDWTIQLEDGGNVTYADRARHQVLLDENGEVVTRPSIVRGIAAVPSGEDYGYAPKTGLMDKFIVGDAAA